MAYYDNAKNNPFNAGDKVYANDFYFSGDINSNSEITLFRIIKSTTSSDLKFFPSGKNIMIDSLTKYKSSFIGTYLKNKLLPVSVDTLSGIVRLYAITPKLKAINTNDTIPKALPKNYIFADKYHYVFWGSVINKELSSFKK